MTKAELESKHLAELHELAAEAGVDGYRMLPRDELIEKLLGGEGRPKSKPSTASRREEPRRPQRPRRDGRREGGGGRKREPQQPREQRRREPKPEPAPPAEAPQREPAAAEPAPAAAARPKRKRRRRRWGRRRKGIDLRDLLLPGAPGRQTILYAESREGCTALLRGLAAELSDASEGADPIALLVDPSPEELADWRREAPRAEIVAAGQARHVDDGIAQAARRAAAGESVFVLIDSLSRFAESFGDADGARELLDAGRQVTSSANGSLTVVAAVERAG